MSDEDEDEIPDWEIADEEVPSELEKKWEREEESPKEVLCRSCGRPVSEGALLCLYCGGSTGVKVGFFSGFRAFCFEKPWGIVIFLTILGLILIYLFV